MPMMRRGPLARYNAEWVLRQAQASSTSGSIEFHIDDPLTLYFRNGRVCDAVEGAADSVDDTGSQPGDEAAARVRVLELISRAMGADDGWYYLDPIGHHVVATPWDWDAASLILDARIRSRAEANRTDTTPPEAPAARAPASGPPSSHPPSSDPRAPVRPAGGSPQRRIELVVPDDQQWVTLSAEAWRIACAMASARPWSELRSDLDWSSARLDAALVELAASGVLGVDPPAAPSPAPVPRAAVAAPERAAAPAPDQGMVAADSPAAGGTARPGGPPGTTPDRRSALRRLISNLRPA